jgi:hypothetical protein
MSKPVRISFVGAACEEWEMLNNKVVNENSNNIGNSENQKLLKSIKQKIELIKSNPQYGDSVPKKLIPRNMPVDNLWIIDLAGFWRMLYTLKGSQIEILCFILEICDHANYDKIFGYRKR